MAAVNTGGAGGTNLTCPQAQAELAAAQAAEQQAIQNHQQAERDQAAALAKVAERNDVVRSDKVQLDGGDARLKADGDRVAADQAVLNAHPDASGSERDQIKADMAKYQQDADNYQFIKKRYDSDVQKLADAQKALTDADNKVTAAEQAITTAHDAVVKAQADVAAACAPKGSPFNTSFTDDTSTFQTTFDSGGTQSPGDQQSPGATPTPSQDQPPAPIVSSVSAQPPSAILSGSSPFTNLSNLGSTDSSPSPFTATVPVPTYTGSDLAPPDASSYGLPSNLVMNANFGSANLSNNFSNFTSFNPSFTNFNAGIIVSGSAGGDAGGDQQFTSFTGSSSLNADNGIGGIDQIGSGGGGSDGGGASGDF